MSIDFPKGMVTSEGAKFLEKVLIVRRGRCLYKALIEALII
jgi:hypothetical protein